MLLILAGCYDGVDAAIVDTDAAATGGAGPGGGAQGGDASTGGENEPLPEADRGSPGVRMLTQREYRNSVEDLLGVALPLGDIPREAMVEGHGHIASAQGIGLTETEQFYELGLSAAQTWAASARPGCEVNDRACAESLAADVLERAFRRPVGEEERARYLGLLDTPAAGESTRERLETLVAAALSSGHFLYRRELGGEAVVGRPGARWLDDYEIATRMSYLVWQSLPDDALLAAAEAGELADPAQRSAQLQRMLADPKAGRGQLGFAYDWLGAEGAATVADKNPEVLDGTTTALSDSVADSLARTTIEALTGGSFAGLLDTTTWWADVEVAAVVGADVEGEAQPIVLGPERAGLLMHPAVIAAHTKESGASPFTIGDFLAHNVLCQPLGSPLELPPFDASDDPDATLRERLEMLTEPPECQFCHQIIGPPGFAFLAFDPIGRHSEADGLGRPFDTTGTVPVGEDVISFESAADLSRQLATHPATARCLARRLFRWTYGYFESDAVESQVVDLEVAAVDTQTQVGAVLDALVTDDAFVQVLKGE
ncbi:MAG: DUF1592 domain-containing protein [Nannocystaceae bacterium]|nr:DUF1592 domain-containing protein [bacterium]